MSKGAGEPAPLGLQRARGQSGLTEIQPSTPIAGISSRSIQSYWTGISGWPALGRAGITAAGADAAVGQGLAETVKAVTPLTSAMSLLLDPVFLATITK